MTIAVNAQRTHSGSGRNFLATAQAATASVVDLTTSCSDDNDDNDEERARVLDILEGSEDIPAPLLRKAVTTWGHLL